MSLPPIKGVMSVHLQMLLILEIAGSPSSYTRS